MSGKLSIYLGNMTLLLKTVFMVKKVPGKLNSHFEDMIFLTKLYCLPITLRTYLENATSVFEIALFAKKAKYLLRTCDFCVRNYAV